MFEKMLEERRVVVLVACERETLTLLASPRKEKHIIRLTWKEGGKKK